MKINVLFDSLLIEFKFADEGDHFLYGKQFEWVNISKSDITDYIKILEFIT